MVVVVFTGDLKFDDQLYLKHQLALAGKAQSEAYATTMAAVRDKLGPEKALLLSHLKHVRLPDLVSVRSRKVSFCHGN